MSGEIVKDITHAQQTPEHTVNATDTSKAEMLTLAAQSVSNINKGISAVESFLNSKNKDKDQTSTGSGRTKQEKAQAMTLFNDALIATRDLMESKRMTDSERVLANDTLMSYGYSIGLTDDDIKGMGDRVGYNMVATATTEAYHKRQADIAEKQASREAEEAMMLFPDAPTEEDAIISYRSVKKADMILSAGKLGFQDERVLQSAMVDLTTQLFKSERDKDGAMFNQEKINQISNVTSEYLQQQYGVSPATSREIVGNIADVYKIAAERNKDDLTKANEFIDTYNKLIENKDFAQMASQDITLDIGDGKKGTMSGTKLYMIAKNNPTLYQTIELIGSNKNTIAKAMMSSSISSDSVSKNTDPVTSAKILNNDSVLDNLKSLDPINKNGNKSSVNLAVGALESVFNAASDTDKAKVLSGGAINLFNKTATSLTPELLEGHEDSLDKIIDMAIVSNTKALGDSMFAVGVDRGANDIILIDALGNPKIGRVQARELSDGSFVPYFEEGAKEGNNAYNFEHGKGTSTKKFVENFARLKGISIKEAAQYYNKVALQNASDIALGDKESIGKKPLKVTERYLNMINEQLAGSPVKVKEKDIGSTVKVFNPLNDTSEILPSEDNTLNVAMNGPGQTLKAPVSGEVRKLMNADEGVIELVDETDKNTRWIFRGVSLPEGIGDRAFVKAGKDLAVVDGLEAKIQLNRSGRSVDVLEAIDNGKYPKVSGISYEQNANATKEVEPKDEFLVEVGPVDEESKKESYQTVENPINQGSIISGFGDVRGAAKMSSKDIEIQGNPGDITKSPLSGKVVFSGKIGKNGPTAVLIEDKDLVWYVADIDPIDSVKVGDTVAKGDSIGTVKKTGKIRLGVKRGTESLDPKKFMKV